MIGDYVVLRCFKDVPAVARVLDETPEVILVLAPEEFEAHERGEAELMPVGFRRHDVFVLDDVARMMLPPNPMQWDKLRQYA